MDIEPVRLIEIGSFKNLWFWIFFSFLWSRNTYLTLGVPLHDARLAIIRGGVYMDDFEAVIDVNIRHVISGFDQYGTGIIAGATFLLASMGTLGFVFDFEIMQACFLMFIPLGLVKLFSVGFAYRLQKDEPKGAELYRLYTNHRRFKQLCGFFAIFSVAVWAFFRTIQDYTI